MKLELSPLQSRVVALTVLVMVCAAFYGLVVQPVWAKHQLYRQSIAQSKALLVKYRRIGAGLRDLRKELEELPKRQATQGVYLHGASDALAAAELQNHVKGIVTSTGGELRSTQILPIRNEEKFTRIAIRVQMRGRIDTLQKMFYILEAGKPFVFIDNFDIRRRKVRRRQNEPERDVKLDVRFDLYGYMRTATL